MANIAEKILLMLIMLWPFFVIVGIAGIFCVLDMICPPVHTFRLWVEDKMGVNKWEEEYDAEDIWVQ